MTNNNPIAVNYSEAKLRILVEEYITMQREDFTFNGVCSFVLYRATEEEGTKNHGLYESNELAPADCERVNSILHKIVEDNRIALTADNTQYVKIAN